MFKFNKNIYDPKVKIEPIEPLLTDSMVLISGDFWGIQKFIFDRLSTKNASKVLRAKSAFIQIFTEYITKYICHKLKINDKYIISESAGKFEIIVPKESIDLKEIQKSIDDYFRDNFYGINGVVLSAIECKREDFLDEKRYRDLRDIKIPNQIEKDRFKKFDLLKTDYLLEYDTNIDNQTLCKICNIRKIDKDDNCKICKSFIELGKKLTKREVQNFSIKEIENFETTIKLTKRVKSYIPREKNRYEPLDFGEIAKNSCGGKEIGIKSLAVIKADVDDMGKFLRENSDITKDFESFNYFSKGLDSFFSEYIVDILKERDGNIYTVLTGGDDLFLIGAWDEVLEFSRFIRNRFREYVNEKLTISFGIALIKPAYPIARLADVAEELLEDNSKKLEGKDAITLFNETVKWDSYLDIYEKLESAFKGYDNIATTTLYRLIDFCEMSKKVKYENDIKSTIWKSKLNYLFYRNMKNSDEQLMKSLSQNIEESPEETKMFLFEFLYKRRKS
jgi:CRISPR-associated protein Csm1